MSDDGDEYAMPSWISYLLSREAYLSIVGVIINIFHIFILTRQEMRTSSTNVIMTGIAISDLYYAGNPVCRFVKKKVESLQKCVLPNSYLTEVIFWIAEALRDNAGRSSFYLGLSMAFIRVLVIKKPLAFDNMTSPRFGLKTALVAVSLSSVISLFYYLQNTVEELNAWTPKYGRCDPADFPENFTLSQYATSASSFAKWNARILMRAQIFIDGLFGQVMPAILFPILTIILFRELQKITANRNKLFSDKAQEKSTLTTRLVTYMTVSFLISTFPMGAMYMTQSFFCGMSSVCQTRAVWVMYVCTIIVDVNTNTHFLINLFVSTQYRSTVKRVLRIPTQQETTNENTVSVTRNPQN